MKMIGGVFALSVSPVTWIAWDAHAIRSRYETLRAGESSVIRLLGTADLTLSLRSRWLRHPTQAEWGAPFQDQPATLDVDSGSLLISAP